jgi:predicted CopG family antitoxin
MTTGLIVVNWVILMPYRGHKSITITEENNKKLSKIKDFLDAKSLSSVANQLIAKAYARLMRKQRGVRRG